MNGNVLSLRITRLRFSHSHIMILRFLLPAREVGRKEGNGVFLNLCSFLFREISAFIPLEILSIVVISLATTNLLLSSPAPFLKVIIPSVDTA